MQRNALNMNKFKGSLLTIPGVIISNISKMKGLCAPSEFDSVLH